MVTASCRAKEYREVVHVVMMTLQDAAGSPAPTAQAGFHMSAEVHLTSCRGFWR